MSAVYIQGASRGLGHAIAKQVSRTRPDVTIFAASRFAEKSEGIGALIESHKQGTVVPLNVDVRNPERISKASKYAKSYLSTHSLELDAVIYTPGWLHDQSEPDGHGNGAGPERQVEDIFVDNIQKSFEVNCFGAMLLAQQFAPLLCQTSSRSIFAAISARVGSIGDNGLGGWYSYRASKAALNSFIHNLAIEMGRRSKKRAHAVVLHPGTVATDFTKPYQKGIKEKVLQHPDESAAKLVDIIQNRIDQESTGGFFDYDFKRIEW